jgi:hypothetical protein
MLASESGFKPGADALGQGSFRDEILFMAWMDQRGAAVIDPKSWDKEVEMGMMQHPAGPGMEDSDKARLATEVAPVSA